MDEWQNTDILNKFKRSYQHIFKVYIDYNYDSIFGGKLVDTVFRVKLHKYFLQCMCYHNNRKNTKKEKIKGNKRN